MREKRTSTISKPKTDWAEHDTLTDEQVRAGIEADYLSEIDRMNLEVREYLALLPSEL